MGKGGKKGDKKGKDKAKTPTMLDGMPADEMTQEQLVEHLGRIKEELDREREERNFFQLERDKIHTFWEITRRQLEERKAELRNKDREMEEAEERHQVEIKVYKQKAKQLLYEHHNASAELRMNSNLALKKNAEELADHEKVLRDEKTNLKVELRTLQLSHQDQVKELVKKQDIEITDLRENFERRSNEIVQKFEKKMKEEREILELRRRTEIHEIEERKNGQIHALMKNHEKSFSDIKNYYNDITLNNLALINSLKEQIEEMKKKEDRLGKAMAEVMSQNRKLTEPLEKAREINEELRRQLANYEKDKRSLKRAKNRLILQEKEMKELRWEREVLEQRFSKLEAEKDKLHKNFVSAIQEVVQKATSRNFSLSGKLWLLPIHWKRKMLSSTKSWLRPILTPLPSQSLRVNSKTFSTRRMARSKISSTSWLEFARLITTSCVHMKRNSPLLGFPWMRLDSNRSNRRSPDKKSERDQPVLFLLPHKNFYRFCNRIKK